MDNKELWLRCLEQAILFYKSTNPPPDTEKNIKEIIMLTNTFYISVPRDKMGIGI